MSCAKSYRTVSNLLPQIDRHNEYRELTGLVFPHHQDPSKLLRNTIVDGELVFDVDPRTKQVRTLRFDLGLGMQSRI